MQQKKEMELQISKRENNDDAEKVKEIVSAVEILKKYKMKELPSEVMTRIIRDKPRGVTVLGFIYTPPANQVESTEELSTIDISGVASTRVALSLFSETLKKDKVFKSVFIPISSFAKDKNIAFTVKLTISKNPSDWSYQDGSALSSTSTAQ
ncbi:MAG: hypothetical protein FGM57_02315 [Candidatus Taylorbacteria bacterium]|nr:hypothetical protein [Candidatus Taylorbacteria bacterium]